MAGPNAPYTQLSSDQVLTQSFNASEDRLRVDAGTINMSGVLEVAISDTAGDSVKIGDGLGDYLKINADGSINVNSSGGGGGGVQYTYGTVNATPTGTVAFGQNPSNALKSLGLDSSGNLLVNIAAGSAGNAAASPTGSAIPTDASYTGFNSGGNLVGVSSVNQFPVSDATTHTDLSTINTTLGTPFQAGGSIGNTTFIATQSVGTNLHVNVDNFPATQPVSGTVAVTQSTSPWDSNVSQFGGSNVVTGTGASGVGIPRVTISNDSNILATQSSTWTVQPGNTPNTTNWNVQQPDVKSLNNNITGSAQSVTISTANMGSIIVQVTGTFSGTLTFTATVDGTNYFSWYGISNTNLGTINSITSADQVMFNSAGIQSFKITSSAWVSGTAVVSVVADQSASGLVSPATGGSITAGAFPVDVVNQPLSVNATTSHVSSSIAVTPASYGTDSNNSSSANLASGATFTGIATTFGGISMLNIMLNADQTCTVQVLQFSSLPSTFNVTDSYTVAANTPDSRTFNSMGQSYQIKVTNNGGSTTTNFQLRTYPQSIGEAFPRALTQLGNFKTAVQESLPDSNPTTQNITVIDSGSTNTTVANGQVFITGTPTANSAASFSLPNLEAVEIQVTGTWTGTLSSEVSMDGGTTWITRGLKQTGTSYFGSSFTANFEGGLNFGAMTNYRVRATAAITGTAVVRVVASLNPASLIVSNPLTFRDSTTQSIANTIKAASTAALTTDTALVVAISPNSNAVSSAVNTNGSVSNSTTVGTTATTFSAPGNAVGFVVEAESSNSVNLRYACGTTATTTIGMLLEPGRDSGYIPSKGTVTVCAVSSSAQAASIQWVLSS